ncbi:MAG: hypothetical protein ABJI69_05095 [Balneola sp.]
MLHHNTPSHDYKKYSEGEIQVWGNSLQLREHFFVLNKRQKKEWAQEQFTEHRVQSNLKHELAYENMVMEEGLEYANEYFKYPTPKEKPLPPKREQGDITEFTNSSRRRFLYKLNKALLYKNESFRFITLTYPNKFPTEGKVYKSDLDVFLKRLNSQFGTIEYIWKLEAQKRGAPHYHLVIFFKNMPTLQFLKKWVSKNWYEVVHRNLEEKDEKHLKAGTNVKVLNNARHLVNYLSKYLSKTEGEQLENQGRFWGASRNWGVLIAEQTLNSVQLIQFRRLLRKYLKASNCMLYKKASTMPTITIFMDCRVTLKALEWCMNNY